MNKKFRLAAAIVSTLLPLLAYPLTFLRLSGRPVPYFALTEFITIPVMGMVNCGILLILSPEFTTLFKNCRMIRFLAAAGAGLVLFSLMQISLFGFSFDEFGRVLFYAATPLMAAVLAPEFKKIIPAAAAAECMLLIFSGIMSDDFTGFAGNWNWNQSLIAAMLPAVFVLTMKKFWSETAMAAIALFFLLILLKLPEQLCRAAIVAAGGAVTVLWAGQFVPEKRRFHLWTTLFFALTIAFAALVICIHALDSRIQLYQATLRMINAEYFCGTGYMRFMEIIPPYLAPGYFFSPFAATNHPHAHNEILMFWSSYGVAGLLFAAMLITAALTAIPRRPDHAKEALPVWIFLIIFISGCFDLTASIPLGAWWMLATAGTAAAAAAADCETPAKVNAPGKACQFLKIAGFITIFAALPIAFTTLQASNEFRLGRLAAVNQDLKLARTHWIKSAELDPTRETLYELAALDTYQGRHAMAVRHLTALSEHGSFNYRHTHRLNAVLLASDKQFANALAALEKDKINYPYSTKNALLEYMFKKEMGMSPAEIKTAWQNYLAICQLRRITPGENLSETDDDASIPSANFRTKELSAPPQIPWFLLLQLLAAAGLTGAFLFLERKFTAKHINPCPNIKE